MHAAVQCTHSSAWFFFFLYSSCVCVCFCSSVCACLTSSSPGVIIGARGLSQQELEKRTGCKIAVRGKGSQSESRPESMRRHWEGEDEAQHVWIAADTEAELEGGVKEVEKLLVPMSEEARRHSLRALAELNGWVSAE